MTVIHVTEATVGLPNSGRLSGTNGDLVGILDVALPLNGWAIEYTSGNNRVYRPGSGNRFRLTVQDDSATSGSATIATVRGAENATNATTYADPFPTAALVSNANANWAKSSLANTTARAFDIFVGTTWVIYVVNLTGGANVWELHSFGDAPPVLAGDTYNTFCSVRGTSAVSTPVGFLIGTNPANYPSRMFWARSYDGVVKSTQCGAQFLNSGTLELGKYDSYPPALSGPSTGIDRAVIALGDGGATSAAPSNSRGLLVRGYMPNLWNPLHGGKGSVNTRDTFTDTAYNASSAFMAVTSLNLTDRSFAIIETSDTWSPP